MNTCHDHKNTIVVYADSQCPLCETIAEIVELKEEIDFLTTEKVKLEDAMAEMEDSDDA